MSLYAKNRQGSCTRISSSYHPERKSASADFFFGWWLCGLYWLDGWVVFTLWCRDMGVLPNAQPCPSSFCPPGKEQFAPCHWRGASPIYADDQFPVRLAWPSVAGAFCLICDGWEISSCVRQICGEKSGSRQIISTRRRMEMEQRGSAYIGKRWSACDCQTYASDSERQMGGFFEYSSIRRWNQRHAKAWTYRSPILRAIVSWSTWSAFEPRVEAKEGRQKAKKD